MPSHTQQTKPSIAIVGDRSGRHPLHLATEQALADDRSAPLVEWIATDAIESVDDPRLRRHSGFLIAPGSPYRGMEGVLAAIRYAREQCVPLLGTCGGFQHMMIEYVRNVLGAADADHAESNPTAHHLAVTPLQCSLAGQTHRVRLISGTQVAAIYAAAEVQEPFYCNYGLNPVYRSELERHGACISGLGEDGEVRVIELPSHSYFIGTLFVPQARHARGSSHPLIRALVAAAAEHAVRGRRGAAA